MAKKTSVTPKGTLVYPWLTGKPDTGRKGKFTTEPTWRTGLALDANSAEAKALMKVIDDAMKASFKEAQDKADTPKARKKVKMAEDKPYRMETDDDDNETGRVIFNFKMRASGKNKQTGEEWSRKVAVFDATGKPLDAEAKIGGGSVAKVSFEVNQFYTAKIGAGVSLRLHGVQIIKLVEWEADASRYGFGDESDDEDAETTEIEEETSEESEEEESEETEEESDDEDEGESKEEF